MLVALVLVAWFTPNTHDGLHRLAGYAVIGLLVFRIAWGIFGTRYSRFHRLPARLRAFPSFLWNLRRGRTERYLGLNPAGAAMLIALLIVLSVSATTGAMQVTVTFFGVWWVEDTHAYSSDAVMILVILHVIGTILMSILQRENLPRAMITGRKRRRIK
jgi:cytochrome b